MCGLSGIAGTIHQRHDSVFRDMLYFHATRGTDSTGVGYVPRNKEQDVGYLKSLGGAWDLLDHKSFDKIMRGWHSVLLGHNRATTMGATSLKNAHPFLHAGEYSGCILGMHNGTVEYTAKNRMKDGHSFSTDSEAIIANIAYEGPEKTIPKLDGAWALVWYNGADNTINMIRNDKRPLCFVVSKDTKTLFWGSDIHLVRAALLRNGIEADEYYSLPEDVMYTWTIPETESQFTAPKEVKLEGRKLFGLSDNYNPIRGKLINYTGTGGGGSVTNNPTTETQANTGTGSSNAGKNSKHYSACRGTVLDGQFKGMKFYGVFEGVRYYFDKTKAQWLSATWDPQTGEYNVTDLMAPPSNVPYSRLDINANHQFKHIGKKKKKQIFFRGYSDTLLTQKQTESYFSSGCIVCNRQPQWGNTVTWINKDHDFLCEFCSEDEALVKGWKAIA